MTAAALAALRGRSRTLWARLGEVDPRYLVSFLITLILVVGEVRYGILGGYDRLVISLGVCVATELALARLVGGRGAALQSAYVTGISLALLLKPRAGLLWPFALGAFLAIAAREPQRVVKVDATEQIANVHRKIVESVEKRLLKLP